MTDMAFEPALSRPRHRMLIVLVCVIVLAGALVGGVTLAIKGLGKAIAPAVGAAVRAMAEAGAFDAGRAAYVADSQRVPLGSVTATEMQAQYPSERWIAGSVAVTGADQVSFVAAGDHVTTASEVQGGPCSYGLAVNSASDPIVAADGLPGPGVYFGFGESTFCTADAASPSGWTKVSRADLFHAGVPVYPSS